MTNNLVDSVINMKVGLEKRSQLIVDPIHIIKKNIIIVLFINIFPCSDSLVKLYFIFEKINTLNTIFTEYATVIDKDTTNK